MTINTLNSIEFSVYVCTFLSKLDSTVYTPLFGVTSQVSHPHIYPSQAHSIGWFTNAISIPWAQWHTPNYQSGQKKKKYLYTCIYIYIIYMYISNSPPQKKNQMTFFPKDFTFTKISVGHHFSKRFPPSCCSSVASSASVVFPDFK